MKLAELTTTQAIGIVLVLGITVITTIALYDDLATENAIVGQYCSEHGCLELQDDGSFIVEQEHPFSGEYKITGNQITLYYSFGKFEAEIDDKKIIDTDGEVWTKV